MTVSVGRRGAPEGLRRVEPARGDADLLVRRALRILVWGGTGVNVGAALLGFLLSTEPHGILVGVPRRDQVIAFVAYNAVAVALVLVGSHWAAEPARTLAASGRLSSDEQKRAIMRMPWVAAIVSLALWAGAALTFGVLHLVVADDAGEALRTSLFIGLGGLTTSAVVYLLGERAMRPVFALVLRDGTTGGSRALGVWPRLVLSWILGSVVSILGLATLLVGRTDSEQARIIGSVPLVVFVAVLAGAAITIAAARSIADRVERMRKAMAEVERGDLETEVPVDDGGEMGLLQAGFNSMVAGMRQRRELEDLFGRHVGAEVARRALERGVQLGGERRDATALFVDIVGSTTLVEQRQATHVVELLNEFFAAVVDAVHGEGGSINKFEGDAALCVFGPPAGYPDHAARALRAARKLQAALRDLARRHEGFDAGIGVSSGSVVAGNVGAEERYEYTVIGESVIEAVRLSELAKGRECRLVAAEGTIERAEKEAVRWGPAGELTLRGRSRRTRVFEPAEA